MRFLLVVITLGLVLADSSATSAQSLKERLGRGLSKVREGAENFGEGAGNVAESVGETLDSTADLVTGEPTPEETRDKLDNMADAALQRLFEEQADARSLFESSVGYAVFDTRKLTLVGLTGGGGRGVAVSPRNERIYMRMGTAGVGLSLGIGGFETQVVIMFEDEVRFQDFVTRGLDASAEAGAMFDEEKENLRVRFVDGRAFFFLTKRGWKIAASAAGTKYWPDRSLN